MKRLLMSFIFFILFTSLKSPQDQFFFYPLEENKFALIIIKSKSFSLEAIEKSALGQAETFCHNKGYCRCNLSASEEIMVVLSKKRNKPSNRNLFQELIIEGDQSLESIDRKTTPPQAKTYPAIKFTVNCY